MNEFFTWEMLATYAGCTAFVGIVTQLFKGVSFVEKIPTRVFAYAVAVVILIAANAVLGTLTIASAGLCVVNAAIVSLAANGAFDALKNAFKTQE